MPRSAFFDLHFRPAYGFEVFDCLVDRLRQAVDDHTCTGILAALEDEGRHLDAQSLADDLLLGPQVADLVRQLAAFGDRGEFVHLFGTVSLGQVSAGSLLGTCNLTTYLFARRHPGQIEYLWRDENDRSEHGLGVRDQPLTMTEMIVLVDAVLVAQAPYDVVDGDWRSGYLSDETMLVQVSSTFYPQLRRWYEVAAEEWAAAQSRN